MRKISDEFVVMSALDAKHLMRYLAKSIKGEEPGHDAQQAVACLSEFANGDSGKVLLTAREYATNADECVRLKYLIALSKEQDAVKESGVTHELLEATKHLACPAMDFRARAAAIKIVRQKTGMGLSEAAAWVNIHYASALDIGRTNVAETTSNAERHEGNAHSVRSEQIVNQNTQDLMLVCLPESYGTQPSKPTTLVEPNQNAPAQVVFNDTSFVVEYVTKFFLDEKLFEAQSPVRVRMKVGQMLGTVGHPRMFLDEHSSDHLDRALMVDLNEVCLRVMDIEWVDQHRLRVHVRPAGPKAEVTKKLLHDEQPIRLGARYVFSPLDNTVRNIISFDLLPPN